MYTIADSSSFGVLPGDKTLAELRLPTFGESGDPTPPPPLTKPTSEVESGKKAGDAEASPFTLGEGLPPVPAKLVSKIRKGEYVDMAELLRDNMELERRRDLRSAASSALGLIPPTSRREVPDLLSWIQCFRMYAAVLSNSYPNKVQQLYAYQTMIVREARRCGGKGWLAYDQMFRQQAAISPADWSKLNNSLYSTTFLQQQNGRGRTCTHCMETDHVANECSLAPLRPFRSSPQARADTVLEAEERGSKGRSSKICYSWNDGRCAIPYCRYRHICAKCSSPSHKAMHCSTYPAGRQVQKTGNAKD